MQSHQILPAPHITHPGQPLEPGEKFEPLSLHGPGWLLPVSTAFNKTGIRGMELQPWGLNGCLLVSVQSLKEKSQALKPLL